ncbi:class I lanthipeptide [Taibaiella chishuiensis]|uniref:Uncharacterized protein n=1 Tax=Taibaiella chishuiensis TaxID=1434707 RepID=A0A2P8D0K8_9BACT|nr:class I lanthipeptide [Taibaiella chishuiensis]PSK90745.1 hypothetical protein B0I18_107155 [Taibaiella chishuiensis]
MKRKKLARKLSLQKKTLAELVVREQNAIRGGMTAGTTCCGSTPEIKNCHTLASCWPEIC